MDDDNDDYFNTGFDDNEFEIRIEDAEISSDANEVTFGDYEDAPETTINYIDVECKAFQEARNEFREVLQRLEKKATQRFDRITNTKNRIANSDKQLQDLLVAGEKVDKFEKGIHHKMKRKNTKRR